MSRTCILLTVYRSQLYLMFKILESVSVLMLALWLVLIKATWEKILSTSAVLKGCMTAMLYSLETSGYIEERFLSLWSTDWNSSFKWVKVLLSEDKICINCSVWVHVNVWFGEGVEIPLESGRLSADCWSLLKRYCWAS